MLKDLLHPISFATGPEAAVDGFTRHRGPVTGVAMIPGSRKVVTSAYDGAVALFDTENGRVELLGYHLHLVNRVVVSDDGRRAASCSSDYTTCIWDLATRRPERVLRGHSDDVEDFLFIGDQGGKGDDLGVSASRDHRILIWNLATGNILRVLEGHEKDVLSLGYHDGRIYSSGDDKTLRVWDLTTGKLLSLWGPFENETDTCAIDPLHQRAILGCDDGCVRVFDTTNGALVKEIAAHTSGIKKVAVSPTSGDILSSAYDQKVPSSGTPRPWSRSSGSTSAPRRGNARSPSRPTAGSSSPAPSTARCSSGKRRPASCSRRWATRRPRRATPASTTSAPRPRGTWCW